MCDCPTEGRHQLQLRRLDEMADIVMDMARLAHREAQARVAAAEAGQPVPQGAFGPDLGLTVDRLTRSLRLTIALEDRLIEGRKARERKAAEEQAVRANAYNDTRKTQVRDFVERLIEHEYEGREAEDRLGELYEYWDYEDLNPRFVGVPIPDLVAKVCQHLDIPFDANDWEDDEGLMEPPDPSSPPAQPRGRGQGEGGSNVPHHSGSSHDPPDTPSSGP